MSDAGPMTDSSNLIRRTWVRATVVMLLVASVYAMWVLKNSSDGPGIDGSEDDPSLALDATEGFDLQEVLSHGLPAVIDFGADSCIPCKEMAPVLRELNEELRGKAIVKFVDVWRNPSSTSGVPIRVIPTQFFFDKDGRPYVPSDTNKGAFILYSTRDTNEHVFTAHEGGMTKQQVLTVLRELGVE